MFSISVRFIRFCTVLSNFVTWNTNLYSSQSMFTNYWSHQDVHVLCLGRSCRGVTGWIWTSGGTGLWRKRGTTPRGSCTAAPWRTRAGPSTKVSFRGLSRFLKIFSWQIHLLFYHFIFLAQSELVPLPRFFKTNVLVAHLIDIFKTVPFTNVMDFCLYCQLFFI